MVDGRMLHLEFTAGFIKVYSVLIWMILPVIPLIWHTATIELMTYQWYRGRLKRLFWFSLEECQVPTEAALSIPLLNYTGKKKIR